MCGEKKAQHLIPTVKYGEGSIMFGAALLPQALDSLLSSTEKKKSQDYQDILQEHVRLSGCQLNLNRSWVMQQVVTDKSSCPERTVWI